MRKIPSSLQSLFRELLELGHGRPVTVENRILGARIKRDISTVRKQIGRLKAMGFVRVEENKISRCRNSANTYHFPELVGFIVEETPRESERELQEQILTSTTPREARGLDQPPSEAQKRWEHRREMNHHPAVREVYELRGLVWSLQRSQRHSRQRTRERMAMESRVGMYEGPDPLAGLSEAELERMREEHDAFQRKALEAQTKREAEERSARMKPFLEAKRAEEAKWEAVADSDVAERLQAMLGRKR